MGGQEPSCARQRLLRHQSMCFSTQERVQGVLVEVVCAKPNAIRMLHEPSSSKQSSWPCTLMLGRSPPPACSALAAQSLLADCRPPSLAYLNQAVQSMSLYTDSQKGACTSAIGARIYSCRSAVCTVVDSLTSLSNDSRVVLVCPESVEPASPNSLPAHCCDLGHASCDAKQSRSDTTKHRSPIYSTRTLSHTLVNPC